jgi:hypothetical protein
MQIEKTLLFQYYSQFKYINREQRKVLFAQLLSKARHENSLIVLVDSGGFLDHTVGSEKRSHTRPTNENF